MKAGKIPVVKVGQSGAMGSVDDFETHFERQRRKGSGKAAPASSKPKLQPLKNPSMQSRIEELGLEER